MARVRTSIETGEKALAGDLFVPGTPNGSAALFVHGFDSEARTNKQYTRELLKNGTACLTFDLSGHGKSTGIQDELSVNDHLADVALVYDYLISQQELEVDPERIGIAGMSYGGYLAVLLSAERRAKSLLLRSPPLYPGHLRSEPRAEYTDNEALGTEPEEDNSTLAAARRFGGSVVLVVSEHDTVVRPYITDAYGEALKYGERRVLEGVGHALDAEAQRQFKPIVTAWAEKL